MDGLSSDEAWLAISQEETGEGCSPAGLLLLKAEQPVEESAVAAQCLTQVLGGDLSAAVPLLLEFRAFVGEELRDALYCGGDQRIGVFDGLSWLVDEHALGSVPASAKILQFVLGEQGRMAIGIRSGVRLGRQSDGVFAKIGEVGVPIRVCVCIRNLGRAGRICDIGCCNLFISNCLAHGRLPWGIHAKTGQGCLSPSVRTLK